MGRRGTDFVIFRDSFEYFDLLLIMYSKADKALAE